LEEIGNLLVKLKLVENEDVEKLGRIYLWKSAGHLKKNVRNAKMRQGEQGKKKR